MSVSDGDGPDVAGHPDPQPEPLVAEHLVVRGVVLGPGPQLGRGVLDGPGELVRRRPPAERVGPPHGRPPAYGPEQRGSPRLAGDDPSLARSRIGGDDRQLDLIPVDRPGLLLGFLVVLRLVSPVGLVFVVPVPPVGDAATLVVPVVRPVFLPLVARRGLTRSDRVDDDP